MCINILLKKSRDKDRSSLLRKQVNLEQIVVDHFKFFS